jgi:high affinity Mn2+ porin
MNLRAWSGPALVAILLMSVLAGVSAAQSTQPATLPDSQPAEQKFNIHGQSTVISQVHDVFHAPYAGLNSTPRHEGWKTSLTGTLYFGARLPWQGGEFYFDPEIAGGEGFGGVKGIAGFTNGEIPRVGSPEPEPYVARLYYKQAFALSNELESVDDQPNQLAGQQNTSRLTVYLGKFSVTDFFDNNTYSHDPRTQFENWALMDNGAYDFAADTRGYTIGGVVELTLPQNSIRYGAVAQPKVSNGGTLDSRILKALGQQIEFEQRWNCHDQPGAARFLTFVNTADMGNYREAINNPGPSGPDVTLTRTFSTKYGFGLSAEQAITSDIGIWGRLSWDDGHTESWAFTEIDRSGSMGLSVKGNRWHRPNDVFGIAGVINGLSKDHRDYLAAGGYGFLIGDGRLNYAPEQIGEMYYLIQVADHVQVTPDFQVVSHPGYNADRGPIFVAGIRAHVEF